MVRKNFENLDTFHVTGIFGCQNTGEIVAKTIRKINKKPSKWRLPVEVVDLLRHKGGAHTTKSGERGYDRKRSKAELRKQLAGS
jgi:hypothetical protein